MPNFADLPMIEGSRPGRRSFLPHHRIQRGCRNRRQPFIPAALRQAESQEGSSATDGRKAAASCKHLEVSSVGLGCQDFTGTFYATHPDRADMITLARTAHEHGVTLFDAAEAYGPLEVERILGEALAPVRNEVVYSSKFGWDIDPDTGAHDGRPEQPARPHPPIHRRHAEALAH